MSLTPWGFFDANVTIGRQQRTFRGSAYPVESLLADMDAYGVEEALVSHALQREVHPLDGNAAVLQAVEGQPRLHAALSLLPPESREMPPLPGLLDELIARGARAVKLFTDPYRLPLSTWMAADLFPHLEERRLPVFVDPNPFLATFESERTDWEGVRQVCERWPELPVIVQEARIRRDNRTLNVLLANCPNLRVEISGYWGWRAIEFITREFGAHRLLFGSRLPESDPSATLCRVSYAEVSDAEKRLIAGENLRALLGEVRGSRGGSPGRSAEPAGRPDQTGTARAATPTIAPLAAPSPIPSHAALPPRHPSLSPFHTRALRGESPHGELLLDCHAHLGRASIYHLPDSEPADQVREMDRLGVRQAVIFSFAGVIGDYVYGNDQVAAALRAHPHRFIAFSLVSPNYPQEMVPELERCRALGFRGIKLIAGYQGYPDEGPALEAAYAYAHELHWPVLNHSFGSDAHLRRLARDYPNATFIRGHGSWTGNEVVRDCANVYDCTVIAPCYGYIERMARFAGPDKILWGSDMPDLPTPWSLGPVLTARIPDDWKRMILGGNLARVLGMEAIA